MDSATAPSSDPVAAIAPQPESPREERALFAIGLRLFAMLCIAIMFALVKIANERGVHLLETLFYRQAVALPIVFGWILFTQGAASIRTRRIGAHISRTTLGLIGMVFNFGTYILLPLTEATTIGFTMPIFATILSAVLLKEATGIHRWSAVLLGFVGVLVVVRPDTAHLPPLGLAVALVAVVLNSFIALLLRDIGRTEGASVTVFWFTLLSMPPLLLAMPFVAQTHDLLTWIIVILIGISGGLAQLGMTGALRWAPVSVVLPMDYSTLIWATALGWLFWNEWPLPTTWVGAALIVASGLYIAWREHVRLKAARDVVVP